MLAKRPGFALVAVLTLALGIGANTAIFSVVNALLLHPLPLPDSEQLVAVGGRTKEGRRTWISYPDFEDLRSQVKLFSSLSAFVPQSVNLTGRDEPIRVRGGFVSDTFFDAAGVQPVLGRGFRPGVDDQLGAERVCVLQNETWQGLFGGDPNILGKTLILNNEPFQVVGVLPAGFRFPFDEIEVWIPHYNWPVFAANYRDRASGLVGPIGRLKPGVTLAEAQTEVETIMGRLAAQYPEAGEGRSAVVRSMQEVVVAEVRPAVLILLGAVGFVLLIASANVANLMLARAATREKEIATRAALGASHGRLVRQLLTEAGVLWLGGGALGLLCGRWALDGLLAAAPDDLPGGITARLDGTVLAYTLGLTLVTALAFGLIPALRFSRPNLSESLKEGSRGAGQSGQRTRLRAALVVGQVALTLVLLVGCGLMVRSFGRLARVDPGFRAEKLLTMEYRLPQNKYPEGSQQWAFHREVVERVRQVPGVLSASVLRSLPFSGNGGTATFTLPDRPAPAEGAWRTQLNTADQYSFETMGIPLLRGRTFTEQDHADAPLVAVINRRMADQFWPGENPIGREIHFPGAEPPQTAAIVGVVGDVKQYSLDDAEIPQVYVAQAQNPGIFNTLEVRTEGDPMALASAVRKAVWSVDAEQPVWKIRTVTFLIDRSVGLPRFLAQLMTAYSGLALLLAAVGLYGVVAYNIAQRTHEIGVRVALGAHRNDIFRLVVGEGMGLTLLGVAIGLAGAFALTRFLSSLLFGVTPRDPITFTAVPFVLAAVALLACWVPARRATRVDPMTALRYE